MPDRHREKPLSLRLGTERQRLEDYAREHGQPVRGVIKDAVRARLEDRAVLLLAPDMPGYDELPDSEDARRTLPPRFHVPVWLDTCTPKVWVCAVCWGDGWSTAWPCETASEHGGEVFAANRR